MWVPYGYFERQNTHGPHAENCYILKCAPIVAAHVWPHNGNHKLAQRGQYRWQTHMSFMWVPCGSFRRQSTWVPCGKLLHILVCPISGSPRAAHERHTRGQFMGPMEFCYLGGLCERNSPVNFPHKRPVTRKMFPFDDIIVKKELSDKEYDADTLSESS